MRKVIFLYPVLLLFIFQLSVYAQIDPDTAPKASIDRFSMEAGHLFVRDGSNGLPGPNVPVNFDEPPFITGGLGPNGELSTYYNFDVQPTEPAPIYVLFKDGEQMPVAGQLNIVDVIPGDKGYNDFWLVNKVTVPQNYVANTLVNAEQVLNSGYSIEQTNVVVNCPIVPDSSTAMLRYNPNEDPGLTRGWYDSTVVYYFNFSEASITTDNSGMVPTSPIYVSFNINPGQPGGGPPSGFKDDGTGLTHNVPATLPGDTIYSPLWFVNIYDNTDFDMVHDLTSAQAANILVFGAAIVNCPIVKVSPATGIEEEHVQPSSYELSQNYPNPFNPTTTIGYKIPESELVTLKVYNILGKEVATLVNEVKPAGEYEIKFGSSSLVSGVYYYQLKAGNLVETKKMILLK